MATALSTIVGQSFPIGYYGSKGYDGSIGYTGSQGTNGNAGQDGPTGPIGYIGSQGDTGYIGSQGDIGYTGSQGDAGYIGSQGYIGSKGDTGLGFAIAKSYSSVAALTADTSPTGIVAGQFAIIETGNVEDSENSRLYLWNGSVYSYVTDLSGSQGITGPQGDIGYTGSQGYDGSIGYTGSQGDIGYTGSQGDIGYTGSQGDIGYTGSQGDIGYTGSQGDIGYTGSQGDIGYTGSQGDVGYIGSQGYDGSIGYYGSQGYNGSIGYVGSQGDVGYIGSQGDIGYVGSQGDIGYTGSRGDFGYTGSQGDSGKTNWTTQTSNYTASDLDGVIADTSSGSFTVTLPASPTLGTVVLIVDGANWNANPLTVARNGSTIEGNSADILLDVPGAQVTFTYNGVTWQVYASYASTGYDGSQGYIGSQGDIGYTGSQGDIGYVGSQGDVGYIGSQGDIGYVGSQGDIGYTGSRGDFGYIGSQGYDGSIGYTGSTGYVGSQGYDGSIGYTGSVGPVGGSNNQILYNSSGVATGTNQITYDGSTFLISTPTTFAGPVTFSGTATYVYSTNTYYTDNIVNLHTPPTGPSGQWTQDDGKDIGFKFHYYTAGTDTNAALVLANDTKWLEWYGSGAEGTSTFAGSVYGTFKTGNVVLVGTATSTAANLGALQVAGGVGIAKDVFVGNRILETKGWVYKTSNYTAVSGEKIIANTAGGTFTVTLPAYPEAGWSVVIADGSNWKTTNLTVGRNGSTIRGLSEDLIVDIGTISLTFAYDGTTWQFYTSMGPQEVASQTGNAGKVLSTDGTSTYWTTMTAGSTMSVTNDTSTNITQYLSMSRTTSGSTTTTYVSDSTLYFNPSTGVLNATDFNSLSDLTFKENIESIQDSYSIIQKLNPVKFNWRNNGRTSYGVLAQDVEKILPEIVNETDGVKSVSYLQLIALLIDSVKYQGKEIEKLKKELGRKKNGNAK